MATTRIVAPLLRIAAHPRIPPCSCARAPAPRPAPARRPLAVRPFATTASAQDGQASWDSPGADDAFAPAASTAPARPSRPPSSKARPASYKGRPSSFKARTSSFKARPEPEPPLPPLSRATPVSALDPVHLHQYRLNRLLHLGRPPTPEELEKGLYPWLKRAYATREGLVVQELAKIARNEERSAQLDLAWEWERQAALQAGLPRSEHDRKRDEIVLERIARRKRQEREARELQRDLRAAEALDSRGGGSSSAPGSAPTEGDRENDGRTVPEWRKHKEAMRFKFPSGWAPPKRLSREAMDLVRTLAQSDPAQYSVPRLADRFKISPEAVRRILKSRFELAPDEQARREVRRKELRKRGSAEGPAAGAPPAWGGDVAAERRELEALRGAKGRERDS